MQFYVFKVKGSSEVLLLVKAFHHFVKTVRNIKTDCLCVIYSSVALLKSDSMNPSFILGIKLGVDEEDSAEEESEMKKIERR